MLTPAESPALILRSEHYPKTFEGRVPLRVRMLETVRSEMRWSKIAPAYSGHLYEVWVNSHGAVAVVHEDGQVLGVKPDEFEVVTWHEEAVRNA